MFEVAPVLYAGHHQARRPAEKGGAAVKHRDVASHRAARKRILLAAAGVTALIGTGLAIPPVLAETEAENLATDRALTGSEPCAPTEPARQAANGSAADLWCSRASTKFLQVDLGSAVPVTAVTVRHAGAAGGDATQNTRSFQITFSTDGDTWTRVAGTTANTSNVSTFTVTGREARYVRLDIGDGAQPGQENVARIREFEIYG
jgi:hypothetical protein